MAAAPGQIAEAPVARRGCGPSGSGGNGKPRFYEPAKPCQHCGKRPGGVFGLQGFGWRESHHEERCVARIEAVRQQAPAQAGSASAQPASAAEAAARLQEAASSQAAQGVSTAELRKRGTQVVQSSNEGESLHWLNALVGSLWPKIDEAVQKIIHDTVTPQIQEQLPSFVASRFKFSKFTLGATPPRLGPIEFLQKEWGIQLEIGVNLNSQVDIELSVGSAKLGVKSLKLQGQLFIQLGPIIGESPVVGGIVVYFLDPPKLDLDFTGLGNVADVPGLAGIVRSTIDSSIASAVVLPNVISVPLGTKQQGVDPALLSQPRPMGIMRAQPVSATGLMAMDVSFFKKSTSDPYVRLRVADREWKSSVVDKTLAPVWKDTDIVDFVVFDRDQKVMAELFDHDGLTADDALGAVKPLTVVDALAVSGDALGLRGPKSDSLDADPKRGTVKMRFDWLSIKPQAFGSDGCLVVVEVKEVLLPARLGENAMVVVKVNDVEKRTPVVAKIEKPDNELDLDETVTRQEALAEVVLRGKKEKIDEETMARITGLDVDEVRDILKSASSSPTGKAATASNLSFERVFYIPLFAKSAKEVEPTTVEFSIMDGKGKKTLGTAVVKLSDVAASSQLRYPASSSSGEAASDAAVLKFAGEGVGGLQARVSVAIQGLQKDAGSAPVSI
eukprot:TRINITY_DN13531_c0_g1_i1.p1 TRINITY_DN13531_c0_g1~~TRINITY_DN13531_c0_g1_i1.p1  ORF type:complete len:694 (-),score=170.95 TRINITY_DN13531_c0_g1_i1:163-2175(-)